MAGASDNGGWSSDGGPPDDLPDLPEEWGVIVIPDDLAELSDEVDAIRAELRLTEGPTRWQRLLRRPGMRLLHRLATGAVRAPVLIISMAVLVTIASLFASAWPGPPRQPTAQRTSSTTGDRLTSLPALELTGADGRNVPLTAQLPAVIVLTEGCDCDQLVADTIAAVRPEIAVVTITGKVASSAGAGTPPTGAAPQAQGKKVQVLHDPSGDVRRQLKVGVPDGTAAVLVVDRDAKVVRNLLRTISIDEFKPDLDRL
jgi:hypothetical protein